MPFQIQERDWLEEAKISSTWGAHSAVWLLPPSGLSHSLTIIPQKTPNPVIKPMARTLYKGLSPRTMMLSTTSSSRLVRRDGGYLGAHGCNQEPLEIFLKYSPALSHIGTLPFLSSLFSLSKAIARALSQLLNNFISISPVRAKPLTLKTLKRGKKEYPKQTRAEPDPGSNYQGQSLPDTNSPRRGVSQ